MMNPFDRRLRAQVQAWWNQTQQQSPRLFTAGVMTAAVVLAVAHYTFGNWVIYPGVALRKHRPFWAGIPTVLCVPMAHWLVWTVVSPGRLKTAPIILAAAAGVGPVSKSGDRDAEDRRRR